MKIEDIFAREIFDSRGIPTIESEIHLDDGMVITSSVPSGISRGMNEAFELRDNDARLMGFGVKKAVDIIEKNIAPLFIGKEPDLISSDVDMIEKDNTENKSLLGANSMLAVSLGICRAQAYYESLSVYELIAHLCGSQTVTLPTPMFNIFGGGKHADNNCPIQEFLLVPVKAATFRESMEQAASIFYTIKNMLQEQGKSTLTGYEGEFVPVGMSIRQILDFIMKAIEKVGLQDSVMLSLDVAATHFYAIETGLYTWEGAEVSADHLIDQYKNLITSYPIYSIEDGLSEVDWKGWSVMKNELAKTVKIVGDDLFATNPQRIWNGIEKDVATTCLIKPNQIGTVTETLQAVTLCKENGLDVIVSHRSGETNDDFIADLAVGVSASHIKAGGFCHGERMAKYNRLLQIEDELLVG